MTGQDCPWCFYGCLAFGGTFVLGFLIWAYNKLTRARFTEKVDLRGKTVLLTGGNTGIGKATLEETVKLGAKVYLACRSVEKANEAKRDILERNPSVPSENIEVMELDLSSFDNIRQFAEEFKKRVSHLDVMINNAGMMGPLTKRLTKDGYEMTMQTNLFGPFLQTNLLMDLMKKSAPCRFVIVSSLAHKFAKFSMENINCEKIYTPNVYSDSKLCGILMARQFAQRLKGTGINVYVLHPGTVRTEFFRYLPQPFYYFARLFGQIFFMNPTEGAQTTLFCAFSSLYANDTGLYYSDGVPVAPSAAAQDDGLGKKLWEKLEEITGVSLEE